MTELNIANISKKCLSSEVPLLILEMYKLEGQLLLSSHSFFAISEFEKEQNFQSLQLQSP